MAAPRVSSDGFPRNTPVFCFAGVQGRALRGGAHNSAELSTCAGETARAAKRRV
jgi:hypothetical protein